MLAALLDASASSKHGAFEVAAVVSQPEWRRKRNARRSEPSPPSPVSELALARGLPPERLFTPEKASDEAFLAAMAALEPDLAITASYGNMLPPRFLALPRFGTLNIHPSLLPLYRGAAPVPRQLQDGVPEVGVTLAYTVKACDAGPVLAAERVALDPDVKTPELLDTLFDRGEGGTPPPS